MQIYQMTDCRLVQFSFSFSLHFPKLVGDICFYFLLFVFGHLVLLICIMCQMALHFVRLGGGANFFSDISIYFWPFCLFIAILGMFHIHPLLLIEIFIFGAGDVYNL